MNLQQRMKKLEVALSAITPDPDGQRELYDKRLANMALGLSRLSNVLGLTDDDITSHAKTEVEKWERELTERGMSMT